MSTIKLTHSVSVDPAEVPSPRDVSDLQADLSRVVREAVDAALRERGFSTCAVSEGRPSSSQGAT